MVDRRYGGCKKHKRLWGFLLSVTGFCHRQLKTEIVFVCMSKELG